LGHLPGDYQKAQENLWFVDMRFCFVAPLASVCEEVDPAKVRISLPHFGPYTEGWEVSEVLYDRPGIAGSDLGGRKYVARKLGSRLM